MASTRSKRKTSTPRRVSPARPSTSELREQLEVADVVIRAQEGRITTLQADRRRDVAPLAVAIVYLACALMLVAMLYARKTRPL